MRYVIGSDAGAGSVDAAHEIWIEPAEGLEPAGRPGTLGAVASPLASPGAVSRTTWSKLTVNVLAAVSPIWIRPTGVVPVFATQFVTICTPSR